MNAGGHIAVAHRMQPAAEQRWASGFALGSALPDFATMGRLRLLGSTADEAVAAGIAVHHRTDDVFHGHQWFRDRNRSLTDRLDRAGLGRGAARACGHVGVELLLDGQLMNDPTLTAHIKLAHDAIETRLDALEPLVRLPERHRWRSHLQRVARHGLPADYHDPAAVAQRLHRILAHRPRLRFDSAKVPLVADALAESQLTINDSAEEFLADLVGLVAAGSDSDRTSIAPTQET